MAKAIIWTGIVFHIVAGIVLGLMLGGCSERCQDGKTTCGGAYSAIYLGG